MSASETGHPQGVAADVLQRKPYDDSAVSTRSNELGGDGVRLSSHEDDVVSTHFTTSWGNSEASPRPTPHRGFAFCGSCDACQTARVVPRRPVP
jgi:hypothetical protein